MLNNAIKFTQTGEVAIRVTLQTQTPEDVLLRFSVSDTGMGIPAEDYDRIFTWTNTILGAGDPEFTSSYEDLMGQSLEMFMYAQALGEDRKANPTDDLGNDYPNLSNVTDADEAVDRLGSMLAEIVPEHTLSDVPVGVFLSGGIDSSAVTAIAAKHSGGIEACEPYGGSVSGR